MPRTGPQFRGPTGQGHSTERGAAARVERIAERRVEDAGARPRLVVAGRRRRPRLADDGGRQSRRRDRCARWRSTSRPAAKSSTSRSSALASADLLNPKNSHASPTPIVDGDRVYVHFGAEGTAALTTAGEIVWKTRLPYESQHGNGGSPVLLRRSADRQLRRQRRGVRRRARQADRQDPLEDVAAPAVGPGVLDAAA